MAIAQKRSSPEHATIFLDPEADLSSFVNRLRQTAFDGKSDTPLVTLTALAKSVR